MLHRAAQLTGGKPLRLVKASRGRAHLLFDVPVIGLTTVETMRETNTTALAVDAGRTLMLDKDEFLGSSERDRDLRCGLSSLRAARMNPLRVAVVGVGSFGRNHARVISSLPECRACRGR